MKGSDSRCARIDHHALRQRMVVAHEQAMRSEKSGSVASSECFWPMSEPKPRSASCDRMREIICSAVLSSSVVASVGCCCEKRPEQAAACRARRA